MSALVRRGGHGTLPDGSRLTWSAAEGARGRRWRSVTTTVDGKVTAVVLLETDASGRPARLEVSAGEGLLTLHPGHDGGLHGNVVTAIGVRHLALGWSARHELLVHAQPIVAAATVARLRLEIGVGEGTDRPAVVVHPDLTATETAVRFERIGPGRWRIAAADIELEIDLDDEGVPGGSHATSTWPLERQEKS